MQALKGVRYLTSTTLKQAVSELSIPVPWGQIRGVVWGPDHGQPVLCLHGWADNCGTFNTLVPLLPKELRYVAVDLPGHGLSTHRPLGVFYSFPSYVADILRVVDALQWTKFSIIGHSMGGNIAGMFSALYPEMVDAVVLLDSFGFFPTVQKKLPCLMRQGMDEMLQFEKLKEKKEKVYTYEKAVERLMAANPSLSEQSSHILLERGLVHVDGGVCFSRDFRINLTNIARITLQESLELQSRIQASVLVVLADDGFGKQVPASEKSKVIAEILQAYREKDHSVVTVPGNHHVHINNPEVVAPVVTDFLQIKVLARATSSIHGHIPKL
ncbi:serine hydrolase-like protein [Thalassophryne amazonica]|uniref:serine hydrolase-like protein n=1 Tax=Thalassophryne amazonica TaxID=390379 RepID=UPI001471D4FB|nr:serine hydrolase-like protein [Thalassophryne amazonica]